MEMEQEVLPARCARKKARSDAEEAGQQLSDLGTTELPPLPSLRFEILEAARILRMSRAALYIRINRGSIKIQKDGGRTYITLVELERYVASCN
jgi:Helix-turn-helix domain